jgi:hypothetical protein
MVRIERSFLQKVKWQITPKADLDFDLKEIVKNTVFHDEIVKIRFEATTRFVFLYQLLKRKFNKKVLVFASKKEIKEFADKISTFENHFKEKVTQGDFKADICAFSKNDILKGKSQDCNSLLESFFESEISVLAREYDTIPGFKLVDDNMQMIIDTVTAFISQNKIKSENYEKYVTEKFGNELDADIISAVLECLLK